MNGRLSWIGALAFACAAAFAQRIQFGRPVSYPLQNGPAAMVLADYNSDGRADLVVANGGSQTISFRPGNGDGTFGAETTFHTPPNCAAGDLLSGDFNGDGNRDVLGICLFGTEIFVLPGHGDGTFGAPILTQFPQEAIAGNALSAFLSGAVAGSFVGSGTLDLVLILAPDFVNPQHDGLYLLPGHSDGTFGTPLAINLGTASPIAVTSADINRDGIPDLAVLTVTQTGVNALGQPVYAETVTIELGTGHGFFAPAGSNSWTGGTYSIAVSDVNGDGIPDLISDGPVVHLAGGGNSGSAVAVYLGLGDGTFQPFFNDASAPGTVTQYFALADLANSGHQGIVEAQWVSGAGALAYRVANGDGTYQPPLDLMQFPSATLPLGMAAADLNADGRTDLVFNGEPSASMTSLIAGGATNASGATRLYTLLPPGSALVFLNTTGSAAPGFTNVNAASFASGALAPSSIVSAFGTNLASATASAPTTPLPTTLGGIRVNVQDAAGDSRFASLLYVSPTQINYVLPDGLAPGTANVTISGGASPVGVQVQIANVAPGLFAVNTLAVGSAVNIQNGVQVYSSLVAPDASGAIVPVPVPVAASGAPTYLVLYGTGIRYHTTPVSVSIGATSVTASYAGAQNVDLGLDQINIAVPSILRGAGAVELTLHVDGQASNTVLVDFE